MKIWAIVAALMFVIGALAETRDTHTVWGQGSMFWLLLGLVALALDFATGFTYAVRRRR